MVTERFKRGQRVSARDLNSLRADIVKCPGSISTGAGTHQRLFSVGGTVSTSVNISLAFCKTDAGTGSSIVCYLGVDGSSASAWNSSATYDTDDVVTYSGTTWKSTIDGNTNLTPGVDSGWVDIEVTVNCIIINSTNLSSCFPTLKESGMMPIWMVNNSWYSLWWFQRKEPCPSV